MDILAGCLMGFIVICVGCALLVGAILLLWGALLLLTKAIILMAYVGAVVIVLAFLAFLISLVVTR